jgi:ribosomal protein L11 methylase PrmA
MKTKNITDIFSKEIASIIRKNGRFLLRGILKEKEFSVFDELDLKNREMG